jgi:peptidyl-prolyl cis-trans isomerase A (cyclophilin A)
MGEAGQSDSQGQELHELFHLRLLPVDVGGHGEPLLPRMRGRLNRVIVSSADFRVKRGRIMPRRNGLVWVVCLLASSPLYAPNKKHLPGDNMNDTLVIETSFGSITVQLDPKNAPLHSANFAKYADDQFFDNLVFHRVIPGFMVQGGGMAADMSQKKGKETTVRNESLNGLKNLRGTLAAARTSDPDSATSQFFINLKDNEFLDGIPGSKKIGYSVFGKVTAGMDVVDKIAAVKTGTKGGHSDVPLEAVVIKSVRRAR